MDPKENARRILRFDHPERVVMGLPTHDISYYGVNHEPLEGPGGHDSPVGTEWKDLWGVGRRKELAGVMGFAVHHPLADLDVERYPWPDPDDERLVKRIYERAASPHLNRETQFVHGSHRNQLWERAWYLVGMDRLMLAFYDAPNVVREILRRITHFQMGIAQHYLACGVEVVSTGDDMGTETSLLLSPALTEEFLVPEWRRLIGLYKEHGVIVTRHCCGHVESLLDAYLRLGIDALDPVQASANDLAAVRRATQGRMTLVGGVSNKLVMHGPPERIRAEVRRCLWLLGREGGYLCRADQSMPFPPEHARALADAVAEFGTYPLRPPEIGRRCRQ